MVELWRGHEHTPCIKDPLTCLAGVKKLGSVTLSKACPRITPYCSSQSGGWSRALRTCLCYAGGQVGAAQPRQCWFSFRADGTSDCCSFVQRKRKGKRMSGQWWDHSSWDCPREEQRRVQSTGTITMEQHPASLRWGIRRGRMDSRVRYQLGTVGWKPRSKSRGVKVPASLQAGGRGVNIVICSAVLWPGQPAGKAVWFPLP